MKMKLPSTVQLANLQHFRRPKIDVGNGDGFVEVAEVSNEHPGGDWTDIGYFFNDEDARLFAATPDMIFVCARLVECLDEGFADKHPDLQGVILIMKQARAAINKATQEP